MARKTLAFVTIDQQGWYFHFHTRYGGWFYKPSYWLLSVLRKSPYIEVISTYGVDDGKTVRELHPTDKNKP